MEELTWQEIPLRGNNGLIDAFSKIKDPRSRFGKSINLSGLLALSFCAIALGNNSYDAISDWGKSLKEKELEQFELKKAPSASIFQKTFRLLNSEEIEKILFDWLINTSDSLLNKIIAFDGKTNRGSKSTLNKGVHLLTAVLHDKKEIIFQKRVSSKSNEIPAMREMLNEMGPKSCVITADAAHTNGKTAADIVKKHACDYLFVVKDNQKDLKKNCQL